MIKFYFRSLHGDVIKSVVDSFDDFSEENKSGNYSAHQCQDRVCVECPNVPLGSDAQRVQRKRLASEVFEEDTNSNFCKRRSDELTSYVGFHDKHVTNFVNFVNVHDLKRSKDLSEELMIELLIS